MQNTSIDMSDVDTVHMRCTEDTGMICKSDGGRKLVCSHNNHRVDVAALIKAYPKAFPADVKKAIKQSVLDLTEVRV